MSLATPATLAARVRTMWSWFLGARQGGGLAEVGPEALRVGAELDRHFGDVGRLGQLPGLGAVGQVAVVQEDDGGHVLDRDPARPAGYPEAVRGGGRRPDGGRGL